MPSTQTRRKRRLGHRLAQLRQAAGLEPTVVAGRLRKSAGTLSKIENGHIRPDWPTLTLLLALYRVTDEDQHLTESLWEDAAEERTQIEHSAGMPPKFRAFLRSEADAFSLRSIGQTVVPGLLQTPAYATAIEEAARIFVPVKGAPEKSVSSRIARQRRLQDERDPLRLDALIDEAVLWRAVGGTEVMIGQLRHLLEVGRLPNVTIRLIPFRAGEYGAMMSSVSILGFDDPQDPDCVYLEYQSGGQWVEAPEDVERYVTVFDATSAGALSPEATAALIDSRLKMLEGT